MFCHKKGHYMNECFQFKKAQDKLLKKKKDDNDSGEEHVKVVSYQKDNVVDLCYNSQHSTEYVYANQPQDCWAIDSGATKHFSSYLQDFESIKRWNTPRIVRLADGSGIEAIGYGDVSIRTTICTVRLHDVWYAPKLACRLVSTTMLNNKGVSVLLKNCKLKAFKN